MSYLEEERIAWDYNVPRSLEYNFVYNEECPLCAYQDAAKWSAPYFTAGVPYDDIQRLLELYFGVIMNSDMMIAHKRHIVCSFGGDKDSRTEAIKQMQMIESDLPMQIDEKKAIDSAIRALYGRKLFKEKIGEYDKEYFSIVQTLQKYIEMKLKMKDELYDQHIKVTLADIIKIGGPDVSRPINKPEPERTGTKADIERVVRIRTKTNW